jgi:predicted transcriptional regulator
VADAEAQTVEARAAAERAREELAAAIVEAARDGVRQVDIQRISGYSRERVRQILRAGGVEP